MKKYLCILLLFGLPNVLFADSLVVRDYDDNDDGFIEKATELKYFLSDLSGPLTSSIGSDDTIGLKELEKLQAGIEEVIEEGTMVLEEKYGESRTEFTIEEVRTTFTPGVPDRPKEEDEEDSHNKMEFYVRQKFDDIGYSRSVDSKISGASIGFSRDFRSGNADRWDFDLSLIGRKALHNKGGEDGLWLLPSLTLDYSDENGNSSVGETDSLVGRLGLQYVDVDDNLAGIYTANLFAATDTSFESQQGGLELLWQPQCPGTAIGYSKSLLGTPLNMHFRPGLRAELGYVFDAGEKSALLPLEDDGFFRVGPQADVDFWLQTKNPLLDRLSATVSVLHLESFGGDSESGTFFESALNYRLDDEGKVTLKLEYEKGTIPLSQDNIDKITLGLGLKL